MEYEVCVVCVYVCVVYGCAWVYMECGHVRYMSVSGVCGVWVCTCEWCVYGLYGVCCGCVWVCGVCACGVSVSGVCV